MISGLKSTKKIKLEHMKKTGRPKAMVITKKNKRKIESSAECV